jgi:hypothetical protein
MSVRKIAFEVKMRETLFLFLLFVCGFLVEVTSAKANLIFTSSVLFPALGNSQFLADIQSHIQRHDAIKLLPTQVTKITKNSNDVLIPNLGGGGGLRLLVLIRLFATNSSEREKEIPKY